MLVLPKICGYVDSGAWGINAYCCYWRYNLVTSWYFKLVLQPMISSYCFASMHHKNIENSKSHNTLILVQNILLPVQRYKACHFHHLSRTKTSKITLRPIYMTSTIGILLRRSKFLKPPFMAFNINRGNTPTNFSQGLLEIPLGHWLIHAILLHTSNFIRSFPKNFSPHPVH